MPPHVPVLSPNEILCAAPTRRSPNVHCIRADTRARTAKRRSLRTWLTLGLLVAMVPPLPSADLAPPLPPLPEPRVGGAAVAGDGKIYYVSGVLMRDGRFGGHATTIVSLTPNAGTWVEEAKVPGRSGFGAAVVGRELFFGGGAMDDDQVSDRHYAWNLDTRRLRETAPLPTPIYQHGAVSLDGKVYVVGGGPRNHALLAPSRATWIYDPASDTWTRAADLPLPMRNLGLVAHRGKLYAIGGHRVGPHNGGNLVQEYTPETNTWRRLAELPTPRTDIGVAVWDGRIFVIGGHPRLAVVESLDPERNAWRSEPALPHGRFAPSAVVLGQRLLVLGGVPDETLQYLPTPIAPRAMD